MKVKKIKLCMAFLFVAIAFVMTCVETEGDLSYLGYPSDPGPQFNPNITYGTLTDGRDGQTYRTVEMPDGNIWMAENLNYATESGSWCYNNDESNCDIYGRLYNRPTAMAGSPTNHFDDMLPSGVQGICPVGWYLSSSYEWRVLIRIISNTDIPWEWSAAAAGLHGLKASSHWPPTWCTVDRFGRRTTESECGGPRHTNPFGFSAIPGGWRNPNGNFEGIGDRAYWFTSSNDVWEMQERSVNNLTRGGDSLGASIRCISCKEGLNCFDDIGSCSVDSECTTNVTRESCTGRFYYNSPICPIFGEEGEITDSRDGQIYRTIVMPDGKTWMAENLNYRTSSSSWCYDDLTSNCDIYGRLYDWATAMALPSSCNSSGSCANLVQTNHQGICPSGWHLSSNDEWTTLINLVGSNAGTKLKSETGWEPLSSWNVPAGTDNFGFSALPGGYRRDDGFLFVGHTGHWWTATNGRYISVNSNENNMRSNWSNSRTNGFSVRCVKDD